MNSADRRRRWMGVMCLGIAILMVVWGEFFLAPSVGPLLQVGFWFLCLVLTVTAILIAFTDLRVLRQRTQAERRALFEETMQDIRKEANHAASRRKGSPA